MLVLVAILTWLMQWAAPRKGDYTPGRPLNSMADIVAELQAVSERTLSHVSLRGVFTADTVRTMTPAPKPGDMWVVQDRTAATTRCYVQVSTSPRMRFYWDVALEAA